MEPAWSALNDPAILEDALGNLGIFFSGIRSAYAGDPYQRMTFSISTDGGASWALFPTLIDPPGSTSWASPVSGIWRDADAVSSGGVYTTWYGTAGVWVHKGTSSAAPAYEYQSGLGNFGYYSNFGLEKNGTLWLVWSNKYATKFGPAKAYTIPSGYQNVWNLAATVSNGKLDLFAHVGGASKADATLHIQFEPPK